MCASVSMYIGTYIFECMHACTRVAAPSSQTMIKINHTQTALSEQAGRALRCTSNL